MIYLKNNTEKQRIFIPKNGEYQGKKSYKEGYEEGVEVGKAEQKSLLEPITITENGTYENENGYSTIEVNVEGGGDVNPDTLREITITENGRYTSKYSNPIKTGEFEDGTPFYGYAELNNISYETGILTDNDTKVELWWCGNVTQTDSAIFGWQDLGLGNFKVCVVNNGNLTNSLNAEINFRGVNKQNLESNIWYHIELSKQEGFKINGELIGTFEDVGDVQNSPIHFNTLDGSNYANGKYGMLKINDTIFIPTENGFVNYANQEPMAFFTEGSYNYGTNEVEGEPYKTINVNIPSAKLQEKVEWRSDNADAFTILPSEGYDGMSKVDVDIFMPLLNRYNEGFEHGKTEGKESVINSLQTLNVTENGTYTPLPMPFLRLDGDDKYEMFNPSENNAFEIKFKVNSNNYEEYFFSQEGNDNQFISLLAYPTFSELYVYWYNKQIQIYGVDFSKWHTLVVKMGDENARVILDGQVYNDYNVWTAYGTNESNVSIYGNIDLEHFTFWNTWEDYNNGTTPFFNFKVTPEGLMRNHNGGEYEVVDNIGGGSAQYMEEHITEGWNEVVVNVPQEGGDCPELEDVVISANGEYEGAFGKVVVDVPQEGGDVNPDILREITITENGVYTSKYSTPIEKEVTGIFDDGTPFYGYGELNGIIYNTQYTPQQNENGLVFEKVEFWYKGDNIVVGDGWNVILSSAPADNSIDTIEFRYLGDVNNYLSLRVDGINDYQLGTIADGYWYHFLLYMENDNVILTINDQEVLNVPKATITGNINPAPFYINGAYYDTNGEGWGGNRNANGCFGMIKINDQTFVPTENGFINYNTQEPLPVVKAGDYSYNTTDIKLEGEPYKTINVDIQPKIGSITITENGTYYPQDETIKFLMFDGDDVFDLGQRFIQDTDDMTIITIDLKWVGDETGEPMNICGVENSDWDSESCFAIRYYDGNFCAKVGSFEMNFPADNEWHHMELGYQSGFGAIVYDGNIYQEELGNFTKPTGNIYVGATNTGGEIFRPFRGYIGDIIIVGNRGQITYYPIDNGFRCDNGEEITNNIGGGYCSLFEETIPNSAPIGYNEIHVNVPQEGGGCNLEPLWVTPYWENRDESNYVHYYPSEGMNGFESAHIDLYPVHEDGKQEVINGLGHLVATEQKTYTAEKRIETRKYIHFDGDDYFYNEYQSTAGLTEINLEFRYEDMQPETYLLGNETYYIKLDFGELSALRGGYYTNPISIPPYTWINVKFDSNGLSVTYDGNTITEPWIEGEERYPLLGGLIIGNNSLMHLETSFYGDISNIKIYNSKNENGFIINNEYYPFENQSGEGIFAIQGIGISNSGDGTASYHTEDYVVGVDGWKSVEVNVDAGSIVAETARVLDITENGTYKSQYSEPTYPDAITGVYPNGENFYSYAQLTTKVFNTGIKLNEISKIEVWYKPKGTTLTNNGGIVGTNNTAFNIITATGAFSGKIGGTTRTYRLPLANREKWYHIELSYDEGFVVDGVNYGKYTQTQSSQETLIWINKYNYSADGYFGMIKIDDTIIIPTADGFRNTNTGELLEVVTAGDYVFTEELPIYSEGNLIKTINVNVQPNLIPIDKTITKNGTYLFTKQEGMDGYSSGQVVVDVPQNKIDIAEAGVKFAFSTFSSVPEWADFSNVSNMTEMFWDCTNLTSIPLIDTSKVTDMRSMFSTCTNLTIIPQLNTTNVINMLRMFEGCSNLTSIPLLDTSNVTNMGGMFQYCTNLTTIPQLDTSNVTNMSSMFWDCENLTSIPMIDTSNVTDMMLMFGNCKKLTSIPRLDVSNVNGMISTFQDCPNLTDIGGLINLKVSIDISDTEKLTRESVLNIFNDMAVVDNKTIWLHENVYLQLTEEDIAIATQKGWSVEIGKYADDIGEL